MSRWHWAVFSLAAIWLLAATPTPPPVVRGVLFYSPTCGHCHYVITEVLPPLIDQYGDRLSIAGVDVSQADGRALFEKALAHFGLESSGVPFLMVGDTYLVGSIDIPQKFPTLIEQYLALGGTDWPDWAGMVVVTPAAALPTPSPSAEPTMPPAGTATPTADIRPTPTLMEVPALVLDGSVPTGNWRSKFARDPFANTLAVFVLIGMVFSVGGALWLFRVAPGGAPVVHRASAVPLICLLGLAVAGYLAYVELTRSQAVCGPVGDCNTVQQSDYARLFGVLSVGMLGVLGYLAILAAWALGHYSPLARGAALTEFALALIGVLFSIYLTFLEPFVIGATCAWCLTSAVLMTLLLWLSAGRAGAALLRRVG